MPDREIAGAADPIARLTYLVGLAPGLVLSVHGQASDIDGGMLFVL